MTHDELIAKLKDAAHKEAARLNLTIVSSEMLDPEMCIALYTAGDKWLHSEIDEEGKVYHMLIA